jgi:pimeloyl-ACP methyl ester carboxylesterase
VAKHDVHPIKVSEQALTDLQQRLQQTRWPDLEPVTDWSQGVPTAWMQELCRYWANEYDWRRCEEKINAAGSSIAQIDGLGIHYLHVRSPESDALPLVLTHGWPGSLVEFLGVIGPLSDPAAHGGDPSDAFHVVVPALPGYGFSDPPREVGWNIDRIARAWAQLMSELGYSRYGAQGGDWGSMVTASIGQQDAEHLAGIHLNMAIAFPSSMDDLTEAEQRALADFASYNDVGGGYLKQQSTRPQTLGYGLADSPAGQAAWVVEKFYEWTDSDGNPESVLSKDQMLDDVMFYWLTNTGASSARLYWESISSMNLDPVGAPAGISVFPREIIRTSERWARERFTDLRYFSEPAKGGHFAAFEQPELFVDEVRTFFRLVR